MSITVKRKVEKLFKPQHLKKENFRYEILYFYKCRSDYDVKSIGFLNFIKIQVV